MFELRRWFIAYCRFCERLRNILLEAPWSSFDLIAASIAFWLGLYLLFKPDLFSHFDKVYMMLRQFGDERSWGVMLVAFGSVGLLNVLWFVRVSFALQLLARMGIAFCFSCLALTNLGNDPPPASAIVYAVLALSTLWKESYLDALVKENRLLREELREERRRARRGVSSDGPNSGRP